MTEKQQEVRQYILDIVNEKKRGVVIAIDDDGLMLHQPDCGKIKQLSDTDDATLTGMVGYEFLKEVMNRDKSQKENINRLLTKYIKENQVPKPKDET